MPEPDVPSLLAERLQAAFDRVAPGADPVLRPSDHADYQANGALALAKRLGRSPREVATEVAEAADLDDVCATVAVSGPGFLNLTLSTPFLAGRVASMAADERLGVVPATRAETVVVDYSAPNVAKEMHVGHLRSTVIGDALCRVLVHLGHRVVRENHVGDWGTPFGMLIEHLLDLGEKEAVHELSVGDLNGFYRDARASFDADEAFRERSRRRVVLLQAGDPGTMRLWKVLVGESVRYFDEVYAKLGVLLTDDDVVGESFYNPMLPAVVAELESLGLLVDDGGARCVFPPGFTNRNGDPLPLIVQKSDGGYGYAATDLAALRDRAGRIGATWILYVVGAPQSQHLEMCFAVARMAGWLGTGNGAVHDGAVHDGVVHDGAVHDGVVRADHVAFGSVLGSDRRMLRTRSGESVRLVDLLDEGVARAEAALAERGADVPEDERSAIARALGIGAVKYADLSTDRIKDYVFDWDRMLAFEGDTGPYLQYAYARVNSIFRRGGVPVPPPGTPVLLDEPAERTLAVALLGFGEAVRVSSVLSAPSKLCSYLFGLATAFTAFYERCPVLRAPDGATRLSRLVLADVTARVLDRGLGLLGMEAPARM